MDVLSWLHISDIHFPSSAEAGPAYDCDVMLEALFEDLRRRASLNDSLGRLDFVFITGDLAAKGNDAGADEYDQVRDKVLAPLCDLLELPLERFIVVPGNHDVMRSRIDDDARRLRESLTSHEQIRDLLVEPDRQGDRELLFGRMENYRAFVGSVLPHLNLDKASCFRLDTASLAGSPVTIYGLNSSWLAEGGPGDKGSLALGEPTIRDLVRPGAAKGALRIALVHHPLSPEWYRGPDLPKHRQLLAASDFLLCGHMHSPDLASVVTPAGTTIHMTAGSTNAGRDWNGNAYNLVVFDRQSGSGTSYFRRYVDEGPQGPEWVEDAATTGSGRNGALGITLYGRGPAPAALGAGIQDLVSSQFAALDRRPLLGDIFAGRDAMDVLFPNVYVDPLVSPRRRPTKAPVRLSEWIKSEGFTGKRVLLLGGVGQGKTTALVGIQHQLAGAYYRSGLHPPLYVEARTHDWACPLDSERATVLAAQGVRGLVISDDDVPADAFLLVDALDEAIGDTYELEWTTSHPAFQIDAPHLATCRADYFERNLADNDFSAQYDEILEFQPWDLETDVLHFLRAYFRMRGGSEEAAAPVFTRLRDAAEEHGFPVTPLSVTAFLFLWVYDPDGFAAAPLTSLGLLLEAFTQLWARREVGEARTYLSQDELIRTYELAAWALWSTPRGATPRLTEVAQVVASKVPGHTAQELQRDTGFLSMLRLKRLASGDGHGELRVIGFVHQAFYELMLAHVLVQALKSDSPNENHALTHLYGHDVNELARDLLFALPASDREQLASDLAVKYRRSRRTPSAIVGRILNRSTRIRVRGGGWASRSLLERADGQTVRRDNICYFWGRVEAESGGRLMHRLYDDVMGGRLAEHPMVRGTIGTAVLLTNDCGAEADYLRLISDGGADDIRNRSYHRVYYGDHSYQGPRTFLEDSFELGRDDWPKSRRAILRRMGSSGSRSLRLRGLDIVTFRRLCETRGLPELTAGELRVVGECANHLDPLPAEKQGLIRTEHERLMHLLSESGGQGAVSEHSDAI